MTTENKITVIDSIMGSGKTTFAINYINNTDDNILYIAPYLEENNRIAKATEHTREFRLPKNLGEGKLGNIKNLLRSNEDIASTHSLFMMFDNEVKEILKQNKYTLFLDEVITAVEPYLLKHKDDIDFLLKKGSIKIDDNNYIVWLDKDIDTRYNEIKMLSKNNQLFYVNDKLLMWKYPPEIFTLFDKIYVMTYLFDSSILYYYFKLNNITYDIKTISNGELVPYKKANTKPYQKLINIYGNEFFKNNFRQKDTALSSTWFKDSTNKAKINNIKNNCYNFVANKMKTKSTEVMWTTFKRQKDKLKGKGYSKSFISCNCKATNEYIDRKYLMYCLNKYVDVGVTQFFLQKGIKINQDRYALSELLQWIWRSQIRNNKTIYIYLPSNRMKNLLNNWLFNKNLGN